MPCRTWHKHRFAISFVAICHANNGAIIHVDAFQKIASNGRGQRRYRPSFKTVAGNRWPSTGSPINLCSVTFAEDLPAVAAIERTAQSLVARADAILERAAMERAQTEAILAALPEKVSSCDSSQANPQNQPGDAKKESKKNV